MQSTAQSKGNDSIIIWILKPTGEITMPRISAEVKKEISQQVAGEAIKRYGIKVTKVTFSIRNLMVIGDYLEDRNPDLGNTLDLSIGQWLFAMPPPFVKEVSDCEDWIHTEIESRLDAYAASIEQIDNILYFEPSIKTAVGDKKNSD